MPYKFTSPSTQVEIIIGFDKYENELLIAHAFPNDVWFHVDKFSSAHVYCRLLNEYTIDSMPETLIEEAAQLTKANSIEGSKQPSVVVIYTPADNLLKTGDMEVGAVSFKKDKLVKRTVVQGKNREMLKHFKHNKCEDRETDLAQDCRNYIQSEARRLKTIQRQDQMASKAEMQEKLREKKELDFAHLYEKVEVDKNEDPDDFW